MNCVPVPTLPFEPDAGGGVFAAGGAGAAVAGEVPAIAADCEAKNALSSYIVLVEHPRGHIRHLASVL